MHPPLHTIDALRDQLQHWEAKHHKPSLVEPISSGCQAFDDWLPKGGFAPGQLIEWLSSRPGSGAAALAWVIAIRSVRDANCPSGSTQSIVVVDRDGTFYPSAAIAWGLKPEQIMIVQPKNLDDTMWALNQALRCSAVTAVWTRLETIDASHFRRLQLSAEEGATLGLFVRPASAQGQPSWSDVQLLVRPRSLQPGKLHEPNNEPVPQSPRPYRRAWELQMLRCRGGTAGGSLLLQMEETSGQLQPLTPSTHETSALHLAAELARPANRRRSARA
jgi:hypothetical protein